MNFIEAFDIRVNGFTDPVGINCDAPEISWQVRNASIQSAWQLNAAYSIEALEKGELCFDSGIVYEQTLSGHLYAGTLSPCSRTYFKIRLFDGNGNAGQWSKPHFFETGFGTLQDFDAMWMGYPAGVKGNALLFRKTFICDEPRSDARLYVASGVAVSYLNGIRLGNGSKFQPPQSDYSESSHFTTYDVSQLLHAGENTLVFHAGSGWYGQPAIKFMLTCGKKIIIRSHASTPPEVSSSAIKCHSIYDGELYDGNFETDFFSHVTGSRAAMRVSGPSGVPRGLEEEPVMPAGEMTPVSWKRFPDGHVVVDFGRNFTGYCRLKVDFPAGRVIKMRYAEQLYPDGNINQQNLQGAEACDTYISGGKNGFYEPEFTCHGFRYVEITGLDTEFTCDRVTGVILRTACRRRGSFKCSSNLLNRIFEMMLHTEESNIFCVPTDCPQRSERMGWLNDMLARNEGANYLFDVSGIYSKYLRDISEAQDKITGEIPMTAPFYWALDIDPVCSSFIECAWNNYIFNGRKAPLEKLWISMKKWFSCLLDNCDEDGIMRKGGFVGDWCPPLKFNGNIETPQNRNVPHGLVSTALIFYTAKLMQKISFVIKKPDESAYFAAAAEKIRTDFLRTFRQSAGKLCSESQTGYAISLYCGLFPEDECACAAAELARIFAANNFKHTTGNIGTKYLLDVLSKYGFIDCAYELVSSEDYPGWGFMLANGATTVWERWEIDDGKRLSSLNHPMNSAPCSWMFRYLGGIVVTDESVGSNRVRLEPVFPSKLESAEVVFESVAGTYRSSWKRSGNKIVWDFEIPCACQAEVKNSAGEILQLPGGVYRMEF